MALFMTELADFLEDEGLGTKGTDLFVGELPAEIESAIMILAASSDAPDMYLDTQYQTVEIWSRNRDAGSGYQKLEDAFTLLHRRANWDDLPNYHVYFSHALGNVDDLDRDVEGRDLFRLRVRFIYRNINNVS